MEQPIAFLDSQMHERLRQRAAAYRHRQRQPYAAWPPCPWQRVLVTSFYLGHGRGTAPCPATLLGHAGRCYYVVPDAGLIGDRAPIECTVNEVRPALDPTVGPGWLTPACWRGHLATLHCPTGTYELRLPGGATVRECYAKAQPGGHYEFQEIARPYRRFLPAQIEALRPSVPPTLTR